MAPRAILLLSTTIGSDFHFSLKRTIFNVSLFFIFLQLGTSSFALTTKTWTGATNNNFNTSTNWSPSGVPSSSDSCVIVVTSSKTISLTGNITVGALYLKASSNNTVLYVYTIDYLLTINGNLHMYASGNSSATYFDLGSSLGGAIVGRHAYIDYSGSAQSLLYSDLSSPGKITFKGDVIIGVHGRTVQDYEPNMLFDGAGTQNVTINNTDTYFLAENLTIGNANNPTVYLQGSGYTEGFGCYDGNVSINGTSIFDINAKTIDRFASVGGTFSIASGASLKISGTADFPNYYGTYSLNAASNTYYDGTNQTITPLTYGHLLLQGSGTKSVNSSSTINGNLSLSGTCTLDINAALDMNGNLTIGSGTTVLGGAVTSTLAGNWSNSGTFTRETSTISFDGSATSAMYAANSTFVASGTIYLTESFENGGAMPANWSSEIVTDLGTDPTITFATASTYPSGYSATAGSYFAKFNSYSCLSGSQVRLKNTAFVSTIGASTIVVNFDWLKDNGYSSNADKVTVQYSTNGSTWTSAGSEVLRYSATNGWTAQSVTLPVGADNQATLYIAFLFTSAYGNNCHLDNVSVTSGGGNEVYAGESFYNLKLNKTGSAGMNLTSKMMIGSSLDFTSGIITGTATEYPEFDEDATVIGSPSVSSHVNGTILKRTNTTSKFTYPVGNGTLYRAVATTPSNANATIWSVKYNAFGHSDTDVESDLVSILTNEYWDVNRSGASPADATLEFSWVAATGVSDYANLTIAHYDGTTDWDMIPSNPVGADASGTITSTVAVSTFSPFALGYVAPIVLPVSLTNFGAINEKEQKNVIYWTTESESYNDFFTIERSEDGIEFREVSAQKGAGFSTQKRSYNIVDESFQNVLNYYRLKQTDFDGKSTYSSVVSVDNRQSEKQVLRRINLYGQEVDLLYKGVVIIQYSDNSILKTVQ